MTDRNSPYYKLGAFEQAIKNAISTLECKATSDDGARRWALQDLRRALDDINQYATDYSLGKCDGVVSLGSYREQLRDAGRGHLVK